MLAIVFVATIFILFSLQTAQSSSLATVQTDPADNNFLDQATLHGQITATGGADCDQRGFDWRRQSDTAWQSWTESSGPYGISSFTHAITALDTGVVYAFRAKARNSAGWSYGNVLTFRVIAKPTLLTEPVTNLTCNSATLNTKIIDNGGADLASLSFRYRKPCSYWTDLFQSGSFGPVNEFSDGFEDGTLDPFESKGDLPWAAESAEFYTGNYCAKSGAIGEGQRSSLALKIKVANGDSNIRFAYRVSSEKESDYLIFLVDDVERYRWSGEVGWQEASTAISPGDHTLEWIYQRDNNGQRDGSDTAWVDDVGISSPRTYGMSATGLDAGATYEFFVIGTNYAGQTLGSILQFTTSTAAPTVSTGDAGSITWSGATLNGSIVAVNTPTACDERGFDWRKQGDTDWQSWTENDAYGTGAYSKAISGLAANTTYEVRAKAHNSVDWGYGDVKILTTDVGPPSVRADPTTSITINSATLNGTIVSTGGLTCDWRGFKYKRQVDPYWLGPEEEDGSFGPGPFSLDISGLEPGATYEFYCYAHNARGYTVSNTLTFVALAAPTVVTDAASAIAAGSAALNGSITDTGGVDCDERGFDWRRQGDVDWQPWTESSGPYGTGSFSHAITGLSPYVIYEFKAKAHNSAGWSYGGTLTFRSLALPPTVTTNQATDVAEGSATLNGSITGTGGQGCDTFAFEWRRFGETSWQSYSQLDFPGFGIGSHSYHIYPIEAGTTYEFRFEAHNSAGLTYGDIRTFTTLHPAIVRTDPATDMTTSSAILHGEILDTGGWASSARGFYIREVGGTEWFGAGVEDGAFPAGTFSGAATGLYPGHDYEFKAYACTPWTSDIGFGEVRTFRTVAPSTAQTDPATNIASTSTDIHGLIIDSGGENCDQRGFEWRRQGETDWLSWAETGDYSKDLQFSDGLEDGTLPPFGTGGLGYGPWTVDSPGAGGSAYCARSAAVSDSQKTYIRGFSNKATRVSFNFKVSSEEGYDSLIFKIDDYQEVARWSGEQDWQRVTFDLDPGQHTFDWWYEKDGSVSQGSDCAWIDDVRIETPFDLHISGLDPATTYEFRAKAHNSAGWSYGGINTLDTGGTPVLDTDAATNVSSGSATLNGEIVNQGAGACDERGFDYRPAGQDSWQSWTEPGSFGAGQFQHGLSSLQPGTGYSFRAKAHNAAGWSYGKTLTFETKAAPTMETNEATSVDHQSAVLNGVIASTGGLDCTERGFQWRKKGDSDWQSLTEEGTYSSDRFFSGNFEDGTLNTLSSLDYNFNMVWRPEMSECGANTGSWSACSPVIPDAKIIPGYIRFSDMQNEYYVDIPGDNYRIRFARKVSSEENHDFLLFFIYTNNNPEPPFPLWPDPTAVWSGEVPWGTDSYAVPAGKNAFYWRYQKDAGHGGSDAAWVDDVVIESTIPFSHKISGLDMGTTYEFRPTAKNSSSADDGYGPIQTFKTAEHSATQTDPAGSVTSSSARLNGRVINSGGENCDRRGFEWRRRGETGWQSWKESGSFGAGQFEHVLSGLKPNAKYEFRAKAHNSVDWSYGGTLTFETLAAPPSPKPPPPKPPNYPNLASTWYLAEGSTNYGFDTYITILNPSASEVTAQITYMTGSGPVTAPDVSLPAKSQATVNPRDKLGNQDFSTKVHCVPEEKAIAVDRTMSWTGEGASSPEAHSSVGVTSPSKTWYLPEGSSKWGFEAWLLIQNPNAGDASCTVTYMIEGEGPKTVTKSIPANSRKSFNIADDIGQKDASIKVEGNIPVIPERAMYRNNRREGHDSIGTTSPAKDFYLAEGTSAYGFTTYVLIQNPNSEATDVTVTYMTPSGPKPQAPFSMDPNSRKTIRANDVLPNTDFSTQVHGTKPVIAERAMYWDNGTGEACHDSVGMASAHTSFYLPDGQTSEGRETYTLVQNPNGSPVTVQITYMTPTGAGNKTFTDSIPANSRMTYNMGDKGIQGRAAIMVTSKSPGKKIMCERAMYWNARGAGTDTIGGYSD